ncbi:MAG: nitronate monooxygenase [Dehalococcoidia bacterium]|nr:nitronate monooxygenase [Dehalococcoidia bacterium]MBL7166414.1 nitronate monooxygenase [Dehalococcoidales bacterium]
MEWKTRVTELFDCKYPILEGAYAGFGNWQFAAACAEAGAHGCITASTSRTPEQLKEDIRSCRKATSGSFGVNLSFGICPRIEDMLEVCIEEKIPVETAIYKPDALAPRIKEGGIPWIHKSARVKDAQHAEELGADAVIVVGLEGVGFKSPEQLPTFITTSWGSRQVKVPFVAAGGIGDARGFLGALAMGADGIMMGTAFMATKECPTNEASKQGMVETSPDNPRLRWRVLSHASPKDYAEVLRKRGDLPLSEWLPMLERIQPKDSDWEGPPDIPEPSRVGSLAVGAIDSIPTVKDFIDGIIREAEEMVEKWAWVKGR